MIAMQASDNPLRSSFLLLLLLINACLLWAEVDGPHKEDPLSPAACWIYIINGEFDSGFHSVSPDEGLYHYVAGRWPHTAPLLTESCRQIKIEEGLALRLRKENGAGKVHCDITPASEKFRYLVGLPLNVNRADKDELCLLPGIGSRLAEKIIYTREKKGRFSSADDLLEVSGIGPKVLAKLHKRLTF